MATLGSATITALLVMLSSDPESIRNMTLAQVATTFLMHLSNTLYHMNKNSSVTTGGPSLDGSIPTNDEQQ